MKLRVDFWADDDDYFNNNDNNNNFTISPEKINHLIKMNDTKYLVNEK